MNVDKKQRTDKIWPSDHVVNYLYN